jgi:hypothetical protein
VLYFAATGSSPWGKEDTSVANTMNQILTKEPDLSLLSENQRIIISQLLDKNPKNRITANDCVGLIEGIKSTKQLAGEPHKFGGTTRKKLIAIASAAVLIVAGGLGFAVNSSKSTPVDAAKTPQIARWSASVVGDPKSQSGTGKTFSLYLCDQSVIQNSLVIKELTNPPTKPGPSAKVITGDARCGSEFDTIMITGPVDFKKPTRDYVLAGSTSAGFLIQYEFSVSKGE